MSTRLEHYQKAGEYLTELDKIDAAIQARRDGYIDPQTVANVNATREYMMKRAEIHALMAGASVEEVVTTETGIWDDAKIREAFIYDGGEAEYHDPVHGAQTQRQIAGEIFDRWLADRDARMRREIGDEIQAEREDTEDGAHYDAYINGLVKAEEIARNGR